MKSERFYREQRPARRRRKGREIGLFMFLAALFVIPMLLIVGTQASLVNYGYGLSELRDEVSRIQNEQFMLRTQLHRLTRPNEIWQKTLDLGLRPLAEGHRYEVVSRPHPDRQSPTEAEPLVARVNVEP